MVVVKLPEFERIAIDPFLSASSGLSPPSAPPMRTSFQASATPRLLPPKISYAVFCLKKKKTEHELGRVSVYELCLVTGLAQQVYARGQDILSARTMMP